MGGLLHSTMRPPSKNDIEKRTFSVQEVHHGGGQQRRGATAVLTAATGVERQQGGALVRQCGPHQKMTAKNVPFRFRRSTAMADAMVGGNGSGKNDGSGGGYEGRGTTTTGVGLVSSSCGPNQKITAKNTPFWSRRANGDGGRGWRAATAATAAVIAANYARHGSIYEQTDHSPYLHPSRAIPPTPIECARICWRQIRKETTKK